MKNPTCNNCHEEIMFVSESGRWTKVEPFDLDPGESQLRRNRVPIPYDPKRHKRHSCSQTRDYSNIYRGD
jgi:hypothetical protein